MNLNRENAKKKYCEKVFQFSENCILKCCNKLPLLRREYLFLAVNGVVKNPKTLHITEEDFFNSNCLQRDQ